MKKLFYPALFHKAEEGGFWITFPDFPECMTQGENMQDAYEMAWDALGLAVVSRIENRESLPPATEPYAITAVSDTFCIIVILSQLVSELPVPDLFLCLCNGKEQ